MNLQIVQLGAAIDAAKLPATTRTPGVSRLLFITSYALGFKTLTAQIERQTADRSDVEAVHVHLTLRGLPRVLGAPVPRVNALTNFPVRKTRAWRMAVDRVLASMSPDRFDCALLTTQSMAHGMARVHTETGLPYGVYIDVTSRLYVDELGGDARVERPIHALERDIFQGAAFVASMSIWAAASVVRDYGVDAARVIVVPNAVPIPARAAGEQPHEGPVRMVIVGNDWERKGGPRLVQWHQTHWADRAELHVISGTAPVDQRAKNVVWHGAVPHARLLAEVLPTMDMFVMPTRTDMSPWAVIEAAGVGLPVVSSRIGALGEIVLSGTTGALCPHDDDAAFIAAVEWLMSDADRRRAMGVAARQHMQAAYAPEVSYGRLIDRMTQTGRERA